MNLTIRFTLNINDFKRIDKPSIKHLTNKYNCSVSIEEDNTNNLWISCYTILVDCPDNTSINNIVRDLYSLFGGDNWHISIDINEPDKLVQTTEDDDEKDCLTVEMISCHGTVGPLQDDLKFLSKELKKYYDSSNVVKIEGSRRIPTNMMFDEPTVALSYDISIKY